MKLVLKDHGPTGANLHLADAQPFHPTTRLVSGRLPTSLPMEKKLLWFDLNQQQHECVQMRGCVRARYSRLPQMYWFKAM